MLMLLLLEWDWLPARPKPENRRVQVLQSGLLRKDAEKASGGISKGGPMVSEASQRPKDDIATGWVRSAIDLFRLRIDAVNQRFGRDFSVVVPRGAWDRLKASVS